MSVFSGLVKLDWQPCCCCNIDVCLADIPLHTRIRQTSDDRSPIVVSEPDSAQITVLAEM